MRVILDARILDSCVCIVVEPIVPATTRLVAGRARDG